MTARILVVAESAEAAQTVVDRLGNGFEGEVATATGPLLSIIAAAGEAKPGLVLLGLGSVAANERVARALRDAAGDEPPPTLLVLCAPGDFTAAGRLANDGIVDHYLPHPDGDDPGRLAISARLGLRLSDAGKPPPPPPAAAAPRTRPIVLMVDDDEFTHQLVAVTLDSRNVELVAESDGAAALDRVREVRPDLVLMDVNLPGRDGVDLTVALKTDPQCSAIPVVMITGEARRETLMRSMEAGAVDFIVKPFTPDALLAKLARFLPALR